MSDPRETIGRCAALYGALRKQRPLIHQITNYVTACDCANATLALGASPIMAEDLAEAAEIAASAQALVLNLGTLHSQRIAAMAAAGQSANGRHIPVVLDPVGAGASLFRARAVKTLLGQVRFSVLRGNYTEIAAVLGCAAAAKGVDAAEADFGKDPAALAVAAARRLSCVVAVTGAADAISDGRRVALVHNGHAMLAGVTGTGCMTTAVVGAFCGVSEDCFLAALAGVATMGIAGELAFEQAGHLGLGSFRAALMDALSRLDGAIFKERAMLDETEA